MTTPLQLRSRSKRLAVSRGDDDWVAISRHRSAGVFSTAARALETISDASCRGQHARTTSRSLCQPPEPPLDRTLVNGFGCRRLEAPLVARCLPFAFRRDHKPATVIAVLPLRSGFRRWFTFRLPSTERLDPSRVGRLFASVRCGPTSPVDFCHRNDPRAPPRIHQTLQNITDGGPSAQLFFVRPSLRKGWNETADGSSPFGAQPAESSRVRGFGCGRLSERPPSPPRSLAVAT